jgi:hypothetical protein
VHDKFKNPTLQKAKGGAPSRSDWTARQFSGNVDVTSKVKDARLEKAGGGYKFNGNCNGKLFARYCERTIEKVGVEFAGNEIWVG